MTKNRRPKAATDRSRHLAHLFVSGQDEAFDNLADDLIIEGADAVISAAMAAAGIDGAREMRGAIASIAETMCRWEDGGYVCVDLFAVAMRLVPGASPPQSLIASSLATSGLFDDAEIRVANGWFSRDEITRLSFSAVRSVLTDIAEGRPPGAIQAAESPAADGTAVLLAVAMTKGEDGDSLSVLHDDTDEMDDLCGEWASRLIRCGMGIGLVVRPCVPSMLTLEVEAALNMAGPPADWSSVPGTAGETSVERTVVLRDRPRYLN